MTEISERRLVQAVGVFFCARFDLGQRRLHETLVDAYTVQKNCGVKLDFSALNSRLQEQGVDPMLAPAVA